MKGWRRHVILEKPVITVLLDEIKSDRNAEIEARFHSGVKTETHDDYVMLTGDRGNMALIPVVDGGFTIRNGRHACQPINATRNFFWVPYFGAVIKAKDAETLIVTIILPVEDEDEAQSIAKSVDRRIDNAGNLSLSFEKAGKTHAYRYKKGAEGLVLE